MRYNGKAPALLVIGLALVGVAPIPAGPARAPATRAGTQEATTALDLPRTSHGTPRNVVFILTDDHRYDALGFLDGQSFIQTPNLDRLAAGGVYAPNAFVTTALCSPSRASILTGLYAHRHRVVDNQNPVSPDLVFFPQYLQRVGYETAFIGKWHMGEGGGSAEPQRGFDYWVSFAGQGHYLPHPDGLNVNGRHVPQRGYITDELTQYALEWLRTRKGDRPFFLYLSHKGVHADFVPPERHEGRFAAHRFVAPKTMAKGACADQPMWVQNQRNSWHGVEYPYHSRLDIGAYYKRYAETLLGVDESVGRVMDYLKEASVLDSTLVIYMSDNGFAFGEHGLIDKRTAYEESMRVPLLMHCPQVLEGGTRLRDVVANIDIAPTILEAVGLLPPAAMDGRSFLALARGGRLPWRETLLYEYFWERNFPHTPTLHALRGDRYKYVRSHGIWDIDELYDLAADPLESKNLIRSAAHRPIAEAMNQRLFETLAASGGMYIALNPDSGGQLNLRDARGSGAAPFPAHLLRAPTPDRASPPGATNPPPLYENLYPSRD
jgi:N-acetylglucosamine-6-sulfatase